MFGRPVVTVEYIAASRLNMALVNERKQLIYTGSKVLFHFHSNLMLIFRIYYYHCCLFVTRIR